MCSVKPIYPEMKCPICCDQCQCYWAIAVSLFLLNLMSLPTVFKHVIVSVWNCKQKQLFNKFHPSLTIHNVHGAFNKAENKVLTGLVWSSMFKLSHKFHCGKPKLSQLTFSNANSVKFKVLVLTPSSVDRRFSKKILMNIQKKFFWCWDDLSSSLSSFVALNSGP